MSSNLLPSLGKLSRYIAYNVLDICHSCRDAPVKKRDLFMNGNYMLICAEPFSFSPKVIFSKSWYINIWRLFTSEWTLICAITYYSDGTVQMFEPID